MKKIILASASPQRKKLLKLMGVKFSIQPSRVKELHQTHGSCVALVKHNALLKARDVAKRRKDGVILGADTLVALKDGRIIGKPKSLSQAKSMLKVLSRQPQWIYTGIALIDVKSRKEWIDHEKTKVEMHPLTDQEIDAYYRHVDPKNKAGGFDVQGKGAFLLKRIEGCYFNVVGLPIAKLYQLFKKAGVLIAVCGCLISLSGCATEYNLATQQQETLIYGTDKEIALGDAIARQIDKQEKLIIDLDKNERVQKILDRIVAVCDRTELRYSIKIIDDDKVNAVSLPGGYVYVFNGLLDKAKVDDELASVIAHEVGHITARHSIKKIQSLYGYQLLKVLSITTARNAEFSRGIDLAFASVFTAYSREDEFEADRLGVKYLKKAGYNPKGMPDFLKKLGEIQEKEPASPYNYWRTHPYIPQRVSAANQEVTGSLEFKDYLNLMGEK